MAEFPHVVGPAFPRSSRTCVGTGSGSHAVVIKRKLSTAIVYRMCTKPLVRVPSCVCTYKA
jgi:hypothetical protein